MIATRRGRPASTGELQAFKARFFRALAHPVRIRLLEILRRRSHTVHELQQLLDLDQPLVSQQLAVLRSDGIVSVRRDGATAHYTLRDPLVGDLLDVARRIFDNHLASSGGLLRQLRRESR
jgi:DNA-binding transcriptional ArsR family regulator